MILDSELAQVVVVRLNLLLERHDLGIVLIMEVAGDEAAVELDNLTEAERLTGRLVQSPRGLDHLMIVSATLRLQSNRWPRRTISVS